MTIAADTLIRPTPTAEVEAELARLMAARTFQAATTGAPVAELWEIASDCVRGGKLLRPRILLGAFDALTAARGAAPISRRSAVRIAAGIELLHFAFLLHDDVLDGDLIRRGQPNLIGRVLARREHVARASGAPDPERDAPRARHWAQASGILIGDMLLSVAHQVFAGEPLPDELRARLLAVVDRTVTESMLGELLDIAFSDRIREADLAAVLTMSRLKTATYTVELPLRAAAILAGENPTTEEAIGRIGAHLGVAFQLQDDLLSTFGRPEEHGKDTLSDLREGKETAIIASARTTPAWSDLRSGFGDPELSPEQADAMRLRLQECGAESAVRALIDDEMRAARELTNTSVPPIPRQLAEFLDDLAASLEGRTS
jgi:geranylgeranyl diphosphate synthase type II